MTDKPLLQAEELIHCYGEKRAVDNVSFELEKGQVLGFIGQNGAGKSSTLKIIAGVLAPDAGRVFIQGVDLFEQPIPAKQAIGYLPEHPPLYPELTVDEQLYFTARIHRLRRAICSEAVANIKDRCGLAQAGQNLIGNLSKGYRQRVGIAQAILHKPPLIILDEPTVGLDPVQAAEIYQLIRQLRQDGHGIILSTHLLAEAQATCTHVQIMRNGRLVYRCDLASLRQQRLAGCWRIGLNSPPAASQLALLPGVTQVDELGDGEFRLHHRPEEAAFSQSLFEQARTDGWDLWKLTPEQAGLEQIFVDLMLKDGST